MSLKTKAGAWLGGAVALAFAVFIAFCETGGAYGKDEHIAHLADLSPDSPAVQKYFGSFADGGGAGPHLSLGYHYRCYVLGLPLSLANSGGSYVVYESDRYVKVGENAGAVASEFGLPSSSLTRPIYYFIPMGWIAWTALAAGVFGFIRLEARSGERRALRLLRLPHYQQALKIAQDLSRQAPIPEAVDHLRAQGVPAAKAQKDLELILAHPGKAKSLDVNLAP